MLALVSQMHDMIHELMRHNNIPVATSALSSYGSASGRPTSSSAAASSALDSYGSAVAQPISALDSYGSAVAAPVSALDSYGAAVAQPIGAAAAPDSYGSPVGQPISASLPTYGNTGVQAQLPTYGGVSTFTPSLATYSGGGQRSSSSIASRAAASDSFSGPSVPDTLESLLQEGQDSYGSVRNRRKNVFVASPKFNPPQQHQGDSGQTTAEEEKAAQGPSTSQKIKVQFFFLGLKLFSHFHSV
jgi:hypothetical protein